jgi:hypothetical protein
VKFKIDENLPVDLVADLHRAAALQERRILLTVDKGIANPIQQPVNTHAGVVLFRPGASGRLAVLDS